MECGHFFWGTILASVFWSTAGADGSEEEDSKERSSFSAEQLVAGSLANLPSDAFDSLKDYSGDPEARAILANCAAVMTPNGTIGGIARDGGGLRCFLADADHSRFFLRDLTRISYRSSFQLAVVDEKPRDAKLYFRVLLTRESEDSQVEYFANWGHDAEKYGYAYQAPQRLLGWPKRQKKIPCGSSRIISLVTIGADSSVRNDVELEVVSGNPSTECLNAIDEYLLGSLFVPGRKGEKLIEARHTELWGNWMRGWRR